MKRIYKDPEGKTVTAIQYTPFMGEHPGVEHVPAETQPGHGRVSGGYVEADGTEVGFARVHAHHGDYIILNDDGTPAAVLPQPEFESQYTWEADVEGQGSDDDGSESEASKPKDPPVLVDVLSWILPFTSVVSEALSEPGVPTEVAAKVRQALEELSQRPVNSSLPPGRLVITGLMSGEDMQLLREQLDRIKADGWFMPIVATKRPDPLAAVVSELLSDPATPGEINAKLQRALDERGDPAYPF